MRQKYEWYTDQIVQQLEGQDVEDIEALDLTPIDLSLAVVKEKSAKWLVESEVLMDEEEEEEELMNRGEKEKLARVMVKLLLNNVLKAAAEKGQFKSNVAINFLCG